MIKFNKIVLKNENIIYPNCHNCHKELSPYLVNEIDKETLEALREANLIIDYINGEPVALFCKECCKIKII